MKRSNHLAGETSPYLKQHAYNPVDWYPWGQEALDRAKREDKPIFLSIGYSACHWCHVMERESFEDEATAELLNRSFVSIKVDREERPDIDSVYMAACQAMTGSGGWPLSVFLTPEGKPFFAGTYYPKTARFGMPGFRDLLTAVETAWKNDREALTGSAEAIANRLNTSQKNPPADIDLIENGLTEFRSSFDSEFGGFGRAPKFPSPHNLLFLLQQYEKRGNKDALDMAEKTLHKMYAGGIFDHIGGGFCRYSTDRKFLVPHFEKMLYDNVLLMIAYSKAYELTRSNLYLEAAESTAGYLLREMRAENGGFFSSQDADSDGAEGLYYLFSPEEVITVLGEKDGSEFNARFDITPGGNYEGSNIPNLLKNGISAVCFDEQKLKLIEYRRRRSSLLTDEKQLAFWNSLAVTAFCVLYRVSGKRNYLAAAETAYDFIEKNLFKDGVLHTSFSEGRIGSIAFLDDNAGLALCELALYGATLEKTYLDKAAGTVRFAVKNFFDDKDGGFFFSGSENEKLFIKNKETYDGATPSGNSLMTYLLTRLSVLAPDASTEGVLEKQLAFMKTEASFYPAGYAMFLTALSDFLEPPTKIIAVNADSENDKLIRAAPIGSNIITTGAETDEYKLLNGKPTYYVCRGTSCLPPSNELVLDLGRDA